ncbi:alkaline phosphatase family protein [Deinococcus hopiensis]|uniref:Phospholipase C n=1 Tax=Deinococcus hopiensis KR-140 TaxID=695939 RepID=A0A1W1UFC9_9DEIO|nr:alkaline phosphatase family protein [Deinococcus hopiensis]SMB79808.1 Phospholipase C [Deinococcus hopiensis KR-140]
MHRAFLPLLSLLSAGTARPAPAPSTTFSHVFVIVLENHSEEAVIGNPALPKLGALARQGALATNDHGVTHPSLPNYVALIAGNDFGSHSDDAGQRFRGRTLPDELEAAGLTWKGYFQSLPSAGFSGAFGGPLWTYVKRHNPFLLFPSIADRPARAARVVPLPQLAQDLRTGQVPNFALIVPDLCHDLHGSLACPGRAALNARADTFVDAWVQAIRASPAWDARAAIVITFDEAEGNDLRGGGGRIPTIVLTKRGPHGVQSAAPYTHYNLLRTLTDGFGLPPLGQSARTAPMTELFFRRGTGNVAARSTPGHR